MQFPSEHLDRILPVGLTGTVTKIVGLTISVAGFPAPLGSNCRISRENGQPIDAQVISSNSIRWDSDGGNSELVTYLSQLADNQTTVAAAVFTSLGFIFFILILRKRRSNSAIAAEEATEAMEEEYSYYTGAQTEWTESWTESNTETVGTEVGDDWTWEQWN